MGDFGSEILFALRMDTSGYLFFFFSAAAAAVGKEKTCTHTHTHIPYIYILVIWVSGKAQLRYLWEGDGMGRHEARVERDESI